MLKNKEYRYINCVAKKKKKKTDCLFLLIKRGLRLFIKATELIATFP